MKPTTNFRSAFLVAVLALIALTTPASAQFLASPSSLTFPKTDGTGLGPQFLILTSNPVASVSFSLSVATSSGGNWLTASALTAQVTTAQLQVNVNTSGLANGTYQGTITVTGGGLAPLTIPVTLTVGGGGTGGLTASPSSLNLNAPVGGSATSQNVTLSSSTPFTYSTSIAYTVGTGNWLTVSPSFSSFATTVSTLTFTASPFGLAQGTYQASVIVSVPGQQNTTVPVAFTVGSGGTGGLTVSPSSLTMNASLGGSSTSQNVTITSPTAFTYSTSIAYTVGTGNWLTVSPSFSSFAATASTLTFTASPIGLAQGTYQASVIVSIPGQTTQTVPVTFTVGSGGGTGSITFSPSSLAMSAFPGGSSTSQNVTLSSSTAFTYSTSIAYTVGTGNWLTVSPSFSSAAATFATLTFTASPFTLAQGTYQASVLVSVPGQTTQSVPVTFTVGSGGTGAFTLNTTAMTFSYAGNPANQPPAQTVTASSSALQNYTAVASVQTPAGGNWLSVTPAFVSQQLSAAFTVSVNPNLLAPGTFSGTVVISNGSTSQTVFVTTVVTTGGGGGTGLTFSPSSLTINYQANQPAPTPQVITMSSGTPFAYSTSVTTSNGVGWLTVSPPSSASTSTAFQLTVSISPFQLPPGTFFGYITVAPTGQAQQIYTVTLNVTTAGGGGGNGISQLNPTSLSFNYSTSTGIPPAQTVNFTATTITTVTLSASPANSWLQLSTTGTTAVPQASFTVSVNPTGLGIGTYNGTVIISIPGFGQTQIPVTLTVNTGGGGTGGVTLNPGALTFNYLPGGANPSTQTVELSTLAPAAFTASAVMNTGAAANWLAVGPFSGNTQIVTVGQNPRATISVGINATVIQLPIGIYTGTITISFPNGNYSPQTINVTLNVGNTPTATVAPNQLNYTYQSGGSNPPSQLLTINTLNGSPGSFTASAAANFGTNWLTVSPSTGTAPGVVAVAVQAQNLTPGTYTGTVSITLSGASSAIVIPVTLNVSSTPVLRLNVTSANFNYQIGGSVPANQGQSIDVSSTGTPIAFGITSQVSTPAGGTWLSVSVPSATTPTTVQVNINASTLTAGTYSGTVSFTASGQPPLIVPVTLNVSSSALINAGPAALTFNSPSGSIAPAAQNLQVSTTGSQITFTPTVSVLSGGNWLSVTPASTSVATASPTTLQVSVSPAGLVEGTYYAAILLTASPAGSAANSPLVVPVVYTVGGSGSGNLTITPGPLSFTQIQGGGSPPSQALNIASSGSLLTYSLAVSTLTGGSWLAVNPTTGITPSQVQVSVNAGSLAIGTYSGSIIITAQGAPNSPQVVPISLTVTTPPSITATPTSLTFSVATSQTAIPSQTITLQSSSANLNYSATASVTAGQPQWLTVTPATGSTPATLTVSVNTNGLAPGSYSGNILINLGLSQPITIPVTFNFQQITAAVINAVTNAASFVPTAVAPGQIITVFGTNLGPTTLVRLRLTSAGTVDTVLDTARVLFDGLPAPLVYVRNDVISAIVPYSIAGRASTKLIVEYQGVRSREVDVRVVDTAPGIFTTNQQGNGQGAIQNPDFSLNGPSNPVSRGQYATVYFTGEGQTTPGGIDGVIATANLLRRPVANVQVRVGGQNAQIIYAGSVPTTVLGLAQVSFFIPESAPTGGEVPVEVIVGGVTSQSGVTMAIR